MKISNLFQSTHDGEHTVHGAHAPPDVVLELKHEADHVLPVTNAELLARDQPLSHDCAVWLLVSWNISLYLIWVNDGIKLIHSQVFHALFPQKI